MLNAVKHLLLSFATFASCVTVRMATPLNGVASLGKIKQMLHCVQHDMRRAVLL